MDRELIRLRDGERLQDAVHPIARGQRVVVAIERADVPGTVRQTFRKQSKRGVVGELEHVVELGANVGVPEARDLELLGESVAQREEALEVIEVPVRDGNEIQNAGRACSHVLVDDLDDGVRIGGEVPEVDPRVVLAVVLVPRDEDRVAKQDVVRADRKAHAHPFCAARLPHRAAGFERNVTWSATISARYDVDATARRASSSGVGSTSVTPPDEWNEARNSSAASTRSSV